MIKKQSDRSINVKKVDVKMKKNLNLSEYVNVWLELYKNVGTLYLFAP